MKSSYCPKWKQWKILPLIGQNFLIFLFIFWAMRRLRIFILKYSWPLVACWTIYMLISQGHMRIRSVLKKGTDFTENFLNWRNINISLRAQLREWKVFCRIVHIVTKKYCIDLNWLQNLGYFNSDTTADNCQRISEK